MLAVTITPTARTPALHLWFVQVQVSILCTGGDCARTRTEWLRRSRVAARGERHAADDIVLGA